jgi:hypothetical protein
MKRILLLSLLIAVSFCASAQNYKLLVGKNWVIDHVDRSLDEENSKRNPALEVMPGDGIVFNADGTYRSVEKGIETTGTWDLSNNGNRLVFRTTDISQTVDVTILSMDETQMLVSSKVKGEDLTVRMRAEATRH